MQHILLRGITYCRVAARVQLYISIAFKAYRRSCPCRYHHIHHTRPFPFRHALQKIRNRQSVNMVKHHRMSKERSKPWMLKAQETMPTVRNHWNAR